MSLPCGQEGLDMLKELVAKLDTSVVGCDVRRVAEAYRKDRGWVDEPPMCMESMDAVMSIAHFFQHVLDDGEGIEAKQGYEMIGLLLDFVIILTDEVHRRGEALVQATETVADLLRRFEL